VTLDDCTLVSREMGRTLDVEDLISTPYTLEVSSPGLNRSFEIREGLSQIPESPHPGEDL